MSLARSQNTKSKCKNRLYSVYQQKSVGNHLFYIVCTFYSVPPARFLNLLLEVVNEIISFYASRGTYDILVTKDNQTRSVGQYDNRGSFGELALMYNTPRAATIVATSEGSLWGLVS